MGPHCSPTPPPFSPSVSPNGHKRSELERCLSPSSESHQGRGMCPSPGLGPHSPPSHWKQSSQSSAGGWTRGQCDNKGRESVHRRCPVLSPPIASLSWDLLLAPRYAGLMPTLTSTVRRLKMGPTGDLNLGLCSSSPPRPACAPQPSFRAPVLPPWPALHKGSGHKQPVSTWATGGSLAWSLRAF